MAAPIKLTTAETRALIAELQTLVAYETLLDVLVKTIGADRAHSLILTEEGKITKTETAALVRAILPLIPGATIKAKVKTAVAGLRRVIEGKEREDAILSYVLAKIIAYKSPPVMSTTYPILGTTPISGWGPVNLYWKMSDSVLIQCLDRMQQKNVRYFPVEVVGNAQEDVLGSPAKLATVKTKLVFLAVECAKRGIYFAPVFYNDNAGKSNWLNGSVPLSQRLPQAKALLEWFIVTIPPTGILATIVAETRTAAGRELEQFGAPRLKAAGFRIGNNNGSRPQSTATFGGVTTDFCVYHNTGPGDWPAKASTHVLGDTGAHLAAMNVKNDPYGLGNPAAIAPWIQDGAAKGQAVTSYYGFQIGVYDQPSIDACSLPVSASDDPDVLTPTPGDGNGWPKELEAVRWLHTNVRDWKVTTTVSPSVAGGMLRMPFDKTLVWPTRQIDGGAVNANPWAIVNIGGQWYAATFEWLRRGDPNKVQGVIDHTGGKGDHFKVSPLNKWTPRRGEQFYIMISGLARSSVRNVQERSNPSKVTWP